MQNRPVYALNSVDNVLLLITALLEGQTLQVSSAADTLGVARSTAHRLLAMLVYHGFAAQEADKSYRAAGKLRLLGSAALASDDDLASIARPHLRALEHELHETVHLIVLVGQQVSFIESVEAEEQGLRVGARKGVRMPAHKTSGGKALLSELSADQLDRLYPKGPPKDSFDDMSSFRRSLATVRRRGYAVNFGESERGVTAVGTCVHDIEGAPIAAVAVSVPSHRLLRPRIPGTARSLQLCAGHIERDLRPGS